MAGDQENTTLAAVDWAAVERLLAAWRERAARPDAFVRAISAAPFLERLERDAAAHGARIAKSLAALVDEAILVPAVASLCELEDCEWLEGAKILLAYVSPSARRVHPGTGLPKPAPSTYDGDAAIVRALGSPGEGAPAFRAYAPAAVREIAGALERTELPAVAADQVKGLDDFYRGHVRSEVPLADFCAETLDILRDFYARAAAAGQGASVSWHSDA